MEQGSWGVAGYRCEVRSGVAGWNEKSECSVRAHSVLNASAGISIPSANFVLICLGAYLFVLVPANWVIFRALDRVEWAWLAVPLIALVGTVAVVRLARLDIGFARSRTEVAIVEMQPGHSRAHVARFTGLYAALSTSYQLIFDRDESLAIPMSEWQREEVGISQVPNPEINLRRGDQRGENVVLEPLAVSSNSTGMVRSEQLLDLGGALKYTRRSENAGDLLNATSLDLKDAALVRRGTDGRLEFALVRSLRAQDSMPVHFAPVDDELINDKAFFDFGKGLGPKGAGSVLQLQELLELATNPSRFYPGDLKLIGWFDNELPGLQVRPQINQYSFRGLLVANLEYGSLPLPESDVNAPAVMPAETEND